MTFAIVKVLPLPVTDYYQPESYIPSTDTYIEKDMSLNDEIDKLRNSATSSLGEREDVIVVASENVFKLRNYRSGQSVFFAYPFNFVTEKFNPYCNFGIACRENFHSSGLFPCG